MSISVLQRKSTIPITIELNVLQSIWKISVKHQTLKFNPSIKKTCTFETYLHNICLVVAEDNLEREKIVRFCTKNRTETFKILTPREQPCRILQNDCRNEMKIYIDVLRITADLFAMTYGYFCPTAYGQIWACLPRQPADTKYHRRKKHRQKRVQAVRGRCR